MAAQMEAGTVYPRLVSSLLSSGRGVHVVSNDLLSELR